MSTFGNLLIITTGLILFDFPCDSRAFCRDNKPESINSPYARMMGRKMGANYEFKCPEQISTGTTEAVELVISTSLSSSELKHLIAEARHVTGSDSNAAPCLVAKLDFIDTDGLIAKPMTRSHQKLIPNGQNQWLWQLKARKPGDYLLSLTLSLCIDNAHGEPIATPVAFNRRLQVYGDPVMSSSTATHPGIFVFGLILAVAGAIFKGISHTRNKRRNNRIEIAPGGKHRVFVSYSKNDRRKVEPIIADLKNAGHKLWIDRHAIKGAATWREEIVEALSNSDYFLFFASESSYRSINCGKELCLAADENLVVIPVLVENCEPSGAGKFVVAGLQRIDARTQSTRKVASELSGLLNKEITNFMRPPFREEPSVKMPDTKLHSKESR